jgi:hypothetical protein
MYLLKVHLAMHQAGWQATGLGAWAKGDKTAELMDNLGVPDVLPPLMVVHAKGEAAARFVLLSNFKLSLEVLGVKI